MLYRKFFYVASFVLVMFLVSSASAVTTSWTNATGNRAWQDPGNWDNGVPGVGIGIGNTQISGVAHGLIAGPIIGPAIVASTADGDTWGPEWGIGIDIIGGSYSGPAFIGSVSVGDYINPSYINLGAKVGNATTGGSINVVNLLIGESWWFHGGPIVTYSQWSGTCIASDWIWLGGKMELYGGYTKATGGMNVDPYGNFGPGITTLDIWGPQADPLSGGMLSLPAGYDVTAAQWIANGYLTANGGDPAWYIKIDLLKEPGRVVLTSVPIPEPTTIALLCLGGLALIRRKRS